MQLLDNLIQKKVFVYIFCFFCICSITISFIYKINLSNIFGEIAPNAYLLQKNIYAKTGGAVSDLMTHWEYIQILRSDITNLFSFEMGVDTKLLNFPLHHIIFSQIYFLADNFNNYLFFFFCFSLTIPFLVYLNISEVFENLNKRTLLLISSLIYILPIFQYTSIWGNNHITAIFFFFIGTLFHLKLKKSNFVKIRYVYLSIIFLSFAAYTKQFYVFFFVYFFIELLLNLKLKPFILVSIFTILLSIPGILFIVINPFLYLGFNQETTNFSSSVLVSSSICFFYLIPFIIQNLLNNFRNKKINVKEFFNIKITTISFIVFFLCFPNFYYEGNIGAGIFYKLFYLILNYKIIFFITSFLGIYFIFFFTRNNIQSYVLSLLLLCTFSSGFFVFQKYFEPMFFLIFLIYFDKEKILVCLRKNNYVLMLYFLTYYISINYIYFFGI
jgi:hypothetical protein